ncbi:uncharacterized protein LOC106054828 isoform X2 [Biomphalaria glabrata]|uniref:Uncharacterized protein LOC106054828 isoform X2 n=1 Tax=Biomphalaria glabrata TaxID=6526 RepID=A0A9W3A5U5_BIOGL|nr:uncharacterized protein LOC106054828 isoform X2 [Biomphalaria glabrata]
MTYTFVICVSLMTICVFVPVFCQPSQCNLTSSNRVIKSGQWPSFGKIDRRDLVEYFVTYINDNNEKVTFDSTNTTNSTRFQPMSCCKVVETSNETVCDDINEDYMWLTGVNITSILATVLILGVIFVLILLSPTGTEDFYLYPENWMIGDNNDCDDSMIRFPVIANSDNFAEFKRKTNTRSKTEVKIKRIKFSVTKRHCIIENLSAITLFGSITEFLIGLDSSYFKPSENLNKCFPCCYGTCLSSDCCSIDYPIRLPCIRFYLGKLVFAFLCIILFLPYYLYVFGADNNTLDSNTLCSAFEAKSLSCPFYVRETSQAFKNFFFAYCFVLVLYFIARRKNYITMIITELPWNKSQVNDKFHLPRSSKCVQMILILNLFAMVVVYVTWGFFLYFTITLILRILIMSASTRNILDDFSFVIFPLFLVIYDYIRNVTKEFQKIAENIFDLLRNDELKFSSNNPNVKTNKAFLLLGKNKKIEGYFVYDAGELRLNINRPLIFLRKDGTISTSKRLVTQIYNDTPEILPFELSAYLKAFLMSLLPCTMYAVAFIMFVTYTSIFSYSTEVAGYTATIMTGLKWLQSKVETIIREITTSEKSEKQRVILKLNREQFNFQEAWIVTDIDLGINDTQRLIDRETEEDIDISMQDLTSFLGAEASTDNIIQSTTSRYEGNLMELNPLMTSESS